MHIYFYINSDWTYNKADSYHFSVLLKELINYKIKQKLPSVGAVNAYEM